MTQTPQTTPNTTYTLTRTGREPVRFNGWLLWDGATDLQKRAHVLALYQSVGGKMILEIRYETEWPRERDRGTVTVCDSMEQVLSALAEYDPEGDVTGFPDGEQFRGRENEIKRAVVDSYERLVSDMCVEMEWVEHVK